MKIQIIMNLVSIKIVLENSLIGGRGYEKNSIGSFIIVIASSLWGC